MALRDQYFSHEHLSTWLMAAGAVPGLIFDTKFGRNADVDAAEDICNVVDGSGNYAGQPVTAGGSALGTAESFELVCASANDTADGTGTREVVITYLDDEGRLQNALVATNGGSQTLPFSGIRSWRLKQTKSGSGGINAGTITLRHVTTTTNIFGVMQAGVGQTEVCAITVPAGSVGVVSQVSGKVDRSGSVTADLAFRVRNEGMTGYIRKQIYRASSDDIPGTDQGLVVEPALTDIKLRCEVVSASNSDIAAHFNYMFLPL